MQILLIPMLVQEKNATSETTNSVLNGGEDDIDIQVFDVEFWMYCGPKNASMISLMQDLKMTTFHYYSSLQTKTEIKVNDGKSERIDIKNIIMQGAVWGSLYCKTSMDN